MKSNTESPPSVGVAFITHCAARHLPHSLPPVLASPLMPRVLVVNSSSNDGTVELAKQFGAEVLIIPRQEFNHGATRELARHHLGTDIVVMMTPDAYATSPEMLANLVAPIQSGAASVAYARQIPHKGANFFEAFPRIYNYPDRSHIRGLDDVKNYGSFLFFCSDTCAAWKNSALNEIGGFPPVLTAEDTVATAKLLRHGHRIAYVSEAVVHHSHHYTLAQEFKRYFDTGYCRRSMQALMLGQRDEAHGKMFVLAMLRSLWTHKPFLLPYGAAQVLAKYAGYKIGIHGHRLPPFFRRALSSQDYFWTSVWFTN